MQAGAVLSPLLAGPGLGRSWAAQPRPGGAGKATGEERSQAMFEMMIRREEEKREERLSRFLRTVGVLAATMTLFGILILAMLVGE